jgi:ferrous iron transport protein B
MVVCLNMMDEAVRKGILIDSRALSAALGVTVVETIAARGQGILDAFRAALALSRQTTQVYLRPFIYAPEVEDTVEGLARKLGGMNSSPLREEGSGGGGCEAQPSVDHPLAPSLARRGGGDDAIAVTAVAVATAPAESAVTFPPARFEALQLLQSNPHALAQLHTPSVATAVGQAQDEITRLLGQPADAAISSARHAACLNLFESVARVTHPRSDWREQVDRLVMHPVWGYAVLVLVFLGIFQLIFTAGKFSEDRILGVFNALLAAMTRHLDPHSVLLAATKGALLGTAGAVAIVLPYLLPFLVCLAVLEDLGYLSRVGYLMDVLMHRLGLHGTATLPVLLGYGCSVPAVMATRILSSRRDRFIAAVLSVLVPCSARMTVIMALVGVYLGPYYALGIYALNLLVVVLAGHILALIWPEISPGMLMEVPAFRLPALKVVLMKTWWRLREFVLVAFPLLVAGSAVLSLIEFYGWQQVINSALSPLTALLGLPRAVGLTLIFGVLRKELSLLMLMQALGTTNVASVMSVAQILIFTLFVTFYIPCMATLASMFRELGWRLTAAAATALLVLAVGISLAARGVLAVL